MRTNPIENSNLTARGAATRARIVSAAADLVWKQGVGATSLDDVMESSAASKSQLYHYFANKDELLREAAALQASRVIAAHAKLLDALDSLDALRRWRDTVLALNRQSGCPLGALVYQLPRSAKRARQSVEDGFEMWRKRIQQGLETMQRNGALARDACPCDLSLAVLTALQGGLMLSRSQRSNRPLQLAFDMAIAYVEAHASFDEVRVRPAERTAGALRTRVERRAR